MLPLRNKIPYMVKDDLHQAGTGNYFLQDNKKASTRALIFDHDSWEVFSSFIFLTLHIFVDTISIVSSDYISNGADP